MGLLRPLPGLMDIGSGEGFGDTVIGIGKGFGFLTDPCDRTYQKWMSTNLKPGPVSLGGRETGPGHGVRNIRRDFFANR